MPLHCKNYNGKMKCHSMRDCSEQCEEEKKQCLHIYKQDRNTTRGRKCLKCDEVT